MPCPFPLPPLPPGVAAGDGRAKDSRCAGAGAGPKVPRQVRGCWCWSEGKALPRTVGWAGLLLGTEQAALVSLQRHRLLTLVPARRKARA